MSRFVAAYSSAVISLASSIAFAVCKRARASLGGGAAAAVEEEKVEEEPEEEAAIGGLFGGGDDDGDAAW